MRRRCAAFDRWGWDADAEESGRKEIHFNWTAVDLCYHPCGGSLPLNTRPLNIQHDTQQHLQHRYRSYNSEILVLSQSCYTMLAGHEALLEPFLFLILSLPLSYGAAMRWFPSDPEVPATTLTVSQDFSCSFSDSLSLSSTCHT